MQVRAEFINCERISELANKNDDYIGILSWNSLRYLSIQNIQMCLNLCHFTLYNI